MIHKVYLKELRTKNLSKVGNPKFFKMKHIEPSIVGISKKYNTDKNSREEIVQKQ